jgi:dTDP-4-dehydrorhamnose 3,5-epimerase
MRGIESMSVRYTKTSLPGVLIIEPVVFKDDRGFFLETHHQKKYVEGGINRTFVQDNRSHSKKGVLRGLHYQLRYPQGKLVYVITGEIFDVAVDIRCGSPTFGKWEGIYLSSDTNRQVFIPEGFAHGFCVLSGTADVLYKCTDFYHPDDEFGILWSDPTISIEWPVVSPILSSKDSQYLQLTEIAEDFLPKATV